MLGTIVAGLIVVVIITAIIVKMVKDKRRGKCTGCDMCCKSCDIKYKELS